MVALVGPGGNPRHAPQPSFPADVHWIGFAPLPPVKLPWQYVEAQEWPAKSYAAGVTPPVVERPVKDTSTVPVEWVMVVGTGWQVEHAMAFESGPAPAASPWFTCAWCAPVAAVPPPASAGGASFTRLPPSASSAVAESTGR